MWFREKTKPNTQLLERITDVEQKVKSLEFENTILRNKVLRKLQKRKSFELAPEKENRKIKKARRLYGGKGAMRRQEEELEEDEEEDEDDEEWED